MYTEIKKSKLNFQLIEASTPAERRVNKHCFASSRQSILTIVAVSTRPERASERRPLKSIAVPAANPSCNASSTNVSASARRRRIYDWAGRPCPGRRAAPPATYCVSVTRTSVRPSITTADEIKYGRRLSVRRTERRNRSGRRSRDGSQDRG